MAKRGRPLPLPGHREPHHDRPPTGQTGSPPLATYRPIGSPLGRRNFGHWPHSTGCLSGQKGEAGLRLLATYGHTLREVASPLTGQRRDGGAFGPALPDLREASHRPLLSRLAT